MKRVRPVAGLFLVALCLVSAVPSGVSSTAERGLTPGHVYALWTSVNDCLLVSARAIDTNPAWLKRLAAMTPWRFERKRPADIDSHIRAFRLALDRLRQTEDLTPVRAVGQYRTATDPGALFLSSGQTLDGLVQWLMRYGGPTQLLSACYASHPITHKTTDDVFGQIDVAIRRLDVILARVAPAAARN